MRRIVMAVTVGAMNAAGVPLLAQAIGPGSDSSGQYHWITECGDQGNEVVFTNMASSRSSIGLYFIMQPPGGGTASGIGPVEVEPGRSTSVLAPSSDSEWRIGELSLTSAFAPAIWDSGTFGDCGPAPGGGLVPSTPSGFTVALGEVVTLGASGFHTFEEVTATLFSTPRVLGVSTVDESGSVSVTFSVDASDGVGAHRVEFTGPISGTLTIEFTVAAAAQGLPATR